MMTQSWSRNFPEDEYPGSRNGTCKGPEAGLGARWKGQMSGLVRHAQEFIKVLSVRRTLWNQQ